MEPTPLDFKTAATVRSALRSAKAVIDMLADHGHFYDNLEKTMGLQGTLDRALAMLGDDRTPARPAAPARQEEEWIDPEEQLAAEEGALGYAQEARPAVATWAKLRGGEFGIKVPGSAKPLPGQSFTVVSRGGKASSATVDRVIWSGMDYDGRTRIHLCSIAKTTGPRYH